MADINRSQFFNAIYVVQFLCSTDPKTGEDLYRSVLEPQGKSANVFTGFFDVSTREEFLSAIWSIIDECRAQERGPILHLETHGDTTGIGAHKNGQWITWEELKPLLTQLNVIAQMNLIITMAACYGLNVVRTILPTDRSPAWAVLGPDELVLPSDISRGFKAFYAALLKDLNLNTALDALRNNDHSWPDTWRFQNAEVFFAYVYGHYLETEASASQLAAREAEITEKMRRRVGLTGLDLEAVRVLARIKLQREELFFERLKQKFFMLDIFPSQAARFPISITDARDLYQRANTGGAIVPDA